MGSFTVTCPHCQTLLEIDGEKEVVVSAKVPEKPKSTTSMEDRLQALTQERESARARMDEAMRAERAGPQVREDRFRKLLEGAQAEPPTKPIRDIDLD
jgi:uncharacterized Zn finger protein (UPF0148 family)